jgi:hypothetical protein
MQYVECEIGGCHSVVDEYSKLEVRNTMPTGNLLDSEKESIRVLETS